MNSKASSFRAYTLVCAVAIAAFASIGLVACKSPSPRDGLSNVRDTSPETETGQRGKVIEFTTSEFTQPSIEVSRDGQMLYFDVLGEIFSVPISGGSATKIELGLGWKERPMLSPDGKKLAFLSDRNGPYGIWVKTLNSATDPVPYDVRDNADVIFATWVSNSEIMTSGRGLNDAGHFSLLTASGSELKSVSVGLSAVWHATSMTSSVDGRYVYFLRPGLGLMRLDRVSAVESPVIGLPAGASQLRMAPDGVHLGFVPASVMSPVGDDPTFSVLNLKTGIVTPTNCTVERNFEVGGDGAVSAAYAFMPGGRSIVLGRGGLIRLCVLDGSTSTIPISADVRVATAPRARWNPRQIGPQLRFPTAAPSGSELALTARGHIWLLDIRDGSAKRLTNGSELEYMPSYSPDGTEIAYVALGSNGGSLLRIRNLETGVERVVISTTKVIANPTWSPDGHRLAFVEALPNTYQPPSVELGWINVTTGQRGTFVKGMYPVFNTSRFYQTLSWDRESEGIFYLADQVDSSTRYFVHQRIGQDSKVLYDIDWSVWDVSLSPSGRYVAFMDAGGISVAPAAGSNVEHLTYDVKQVSGLKRVTDSVVDYMTWLPDDRLAWSVQDEVSVSNSEFSQQKNMEVVIPGAESAPSRRRIAYVGARIITMTSKGVIEDGLVVTNGSHIEYVGPLSDNAIVNAEIVDVKGKTIIPGLIDVHQHERWVNLDVTPQLSHRLFVSAAYGVTTVFDPSFFDIDGSVLRELSSEDSYLGATFYTSGTVLLGTTGNAAYTRVDSYEDAVKFVRRKAQAGSVVVKDYLQPTRNQRRWLAQAAREAGLGITGHERNDIRTHMTMVVDGYTGLEHSLFLGSGHLYGDIQRFLVTSGISMTPTLAEAYVDNAYGMWAGFHFYKSTPSSDMHLRCLTDDAAAKLLAKLPKDWMEGNKSALFDIAKQYAQMLNDGGFVTIGDHNMPEGIGTHWEMWNLNMAGATPMNVLRAATINGAVKLGLESRIGSLDKGMDADFVVLNRNPLDDIKNTADISRVIRRGRTMSWPTLKHQPTTWTAQASWDECKKWNLGLPSAITPTLDGALQAVENSR